MPSSRQRALRGAFIVVLIAAAGCQRTEVPEVPEPVPVAVPAPPGSAQPFVAADADGFLVSWTEPAPGGHALRFARTDGLHWSVPLTIAEGADWFVNWADFPALLAGDGFMAAHWLQRSGPGRYSYDVMLTVSPDGGRTWSPAVLPHGDGTETEHGFVSLFPHGEGFGAVWLDGRQFAHGDHGHDQPGSDMQVRFTTVSAAGEPGPETVLDGRACDCCQTAVALTTEGPVVFYRDRSPEEIRDISVTRLEGGRWTEPRTVHEDGWHITGCPVNGPAADAAGDDVVRAWFTAAGESPRVHVAFSGDAARTFDAPIRIDDGAAIGRVDVVMMDNDVAFVVWLENAGDAAEVRGRLVHRRSGPGPARTIAATSAQRASGFPRMARREDRVLLAWTEAGDPSRIRAALLGFDR